MQAIPSAPGVYPGTTTNQDYRAGGPAPGGVALGVGGQMRIALERSASLREVPRCRGARATVPWRGPRIRFIVTAHVVADDAYLARAVADLVRRIGPRPVDLTGNGNTFRSCVLDSARVSHTDAKHTQVVFEFLKEV